MVESKASRHKSAYPRPGLRLIMLLVGLLIMALPLSGLYLFRIYENELVRQTESELIAQAALAGAMYKAEALRLGGPGFGRKISGLPPAADGEYIFVNPRLDLSRDEIQPQGINFRPSAYEADPVALEAARNIEKIIREGERITLSRIFILDAHGLVLAGPRGHGLSLADNFEVSEALSGHYQSVMRFRDESTPRQAPLSSGMRRARFYVFFALPVMNGDRLCGVVYLSRTPREIIQALYGEKQNVILAGLLSLGLVALVSLVVSLLIINPVRGLAEESLAVMLGQSPELEGQSGPIVVRELAELRLVVSDMARRLRHRSDYLKAFASGVSHEFKTPLTSIKGALELISEHGENMDEATRQRFQGNILADIERLERLVAQLLSLARAEAKAEALEQETQISEVTEIVGLIKGLAERYRARNFSIKYQGPGRLGLAVNADVLETVLRNLFDNSLSVGADLSMVEINPDPRDRTCDLYITDNGPGIPEEVQDSIFTPFFTTRKNDGGTGLGLSLARTLLAPYRGELHLLENEGAGAAFVITLPLAPAPKAIKKSKQ